eukprot:TRINITY_DN16025_c0_g1_i1.p1 TRINITY_DN16025_c0_g1~~TRINITY_DN16025_c0_g1_i1.p1  ORF type:complete len:131 (+),score=40.64 TRINITY_DN16025_c0_g1_i1:73-465(+)
MSFSQSESRYFSNNKIFNGDDGIGNHFQQQQKQVCNNDVNDPFEKEFGNGVCYSYVDYIEERDKEIQKVEQGLLDINYMMTEINTIVKNQGNFVDDICFNIENASKHVDKGVENLEKANKNTSVTGCLIC